MLVIFNIPISSDPLNVNNFPEGLTPLENVDTYVKYHHLDLQKSDQDGKTKTYGPDQSDSSQFSPQPIH